MIDCQKTDYHHLLLTWWNVWDLMIVYVDCHRCRVKRGAKDDLIVCPDIACDNLKDAEHLASTLALYHLCRGQVRSCPIILLSIIINIKFLHLLSDHPL